MKPRKIAAATALLSLDVAVESSLLRRREVARAVPMGQYSYSPLADPMDQYSYPLAQSLWRINASHAKVNLLRLLASC